MSLARPWAALPEGILEAWTAGAQFSSKSHTGELSAGTPRLLSKAEELEGVESQAPMDAAGMDIAILTCLCHSSLGGCFQHIW